MGIIGLHNQGSNSMDASGEGKDAGYRSLFQAFR
jgi:hypothetical protein